MLPRQFDLRKLVSLTGRHFSSDVRRLIPVGQLSEGHAEIYKPGQIFLNKTFAYRGIVIASFDCKEFKRRDNSKFSVVPYYQVLVHRGDWAEMRFPADHTAFLADSKGEKVLNLINGMDSVPHDDILPLNIVPSSSDESFKSPIEHDLFSTLFKLVDVNKPELGFEPIRNLNKQRSWMKPITHFEHSVDSIFCCITTFYLGSSISTGQLKHYWRYVIRVQNDSNESVVLKERSIKIFSLNNLTQVTAQGVLGDFPVLSLDHPAYQFSSTIDLPQKKGGHLWGRLIFQRGDSSTFEVDLPTVTLECDSEKNSTNTSENAIY